MKLRKRIAAALTALALMFTLTDPAALGGILSIAGTAFADIFAQFYLKTAIPMPVPEASASSLDNYFTPKDGPVSLSSVTWYLGSPEYDSNGALKNKEAVTTFGYNKTYYAVAKYTTTGGNTPSSSVYLYYQKQGDPTTILAKTWVDSTVVSALFDFSDYTTPKPKAMNAYFQDVSGATNGDDTVYYTNQNGKQFKAHTDISTIDSALPKSVKIKTQDSSLILNGSVTWLSKDGFTFSGKKYSGDEIKEAIDGLSFTIVGAVTINSDEGVYNKPDQALEVYAQIEIAPADKLADPVFSNETPSGRTYDNIVRVKLNAPADVGQFYYTISTDQKTLENPTGGAESQHYNSVDGILLEGEISKSVTYYVRVVSYYSGYRQSGYLDGVFTVERKPTSATNIPEIHILITVPVGGKPLDETAELDPDRTSSQVSEKLAISSFGAVGWSGGSESTVADYNTIYTSTVEIVPSTNYLFLRTTEVYVNGIRAVGTPTGTGTFIITFTYPRTQKLNNYEIVSPGIVDNVKSGTTVTQMEEKSLPATVKVVVPKDNRIEENCRVTWDLSSAVIEDGTPYNPKLGNAHLVTITGTVTLPNYMEVNPTIGSTVTAQVYVEEAQKMPAPTANPPDTDSKLETTVFNSPQDITLSSSVSGATIYYTMEYYETLAEIDLADPTEAGGTKYIEPITLSGVPGNSLYYCIKAIATAPGMKQSNVATFIYQVVIQKKTTAVPTPTPAPGQYDSSLTITLNSETPGAKIFYTLDPTATKKNGFIEYTGPFDLTVAPNTTKSFALRCYAQAPNDSWKDSDISSDYIYTITVPKERAAVPVPSTLDTASESAITLTLSCATATADIYYSLDKEITADYPGILYKSGTKINLKRVDNEVVQYKLYTYAKSNDPNMDNSLVKTYTYTIGVNYGVKMIEIVKRPAKYSYYMGEKLSVTGGVIKVTYEDETKPTQNVYMTESMIQDFDSWILGQQTLTVYYQGCTTAFNIVVRRRSSSTTDDSKTDDDKKDDNTSGGKTDTSTDTDKTDTDSSSTSDGTVTEPTMEGSAVKGWTQLQKKIAAAAKNSRLKIYLNGNTSVPADIINTAMKKKITLEFVVDDMISWVIDTGTLKKTVASVSVGLKNNDVYIPSVLIDSAGESEITRVHTYGVNKVGAVLYVKTGKKVNNRFANLFRYNDVTHQLDFIDTSKIIASTGIAQVAPTVGGDYVLMYDTRTMLPGDADNSTTIDARDASAILKMVVGIMEMDDTCDFNGDGFVNAMDSSAILRSVVGLYR